MRSYDESALLTELSQLPLQAQSAFAQACAWRAVNALTEQGREDLRSLCVAVLDAVAPSDDAAASKLLLELEGHEQLDQDGVAACAYVLRHKLTGQAQEVAWAASRAYEATDRVAQSSFAFTQFTPEVEARLLSHPRVQWELASQAEDLEVLRTNPVAWAQVVARAKQASAP